MESVTTVISEITSSATEDNVIYNLAGQRVSKANGIAIKNGKKYVVK